MDVQQPNLSLRTCQIQTAFKHISRKVAFKITLWKSHVYVLHISIRT